MSMPNNCWGAIYARSGLATKEGMRPANCVGVVDSDYRGEYIVPLRNDSSSVRTVRHGDRIAQLVVMPYLPLEFRVVDELPESERGEAGFGSTGK